MTNPYQLLIQSGGPAEMSATELAIVIASTNAYDIDRYALKLTDDQRADALWRLADHVRRGGTIEALTTGAMLALFDHLTTDQTRAEYYAHMSEETGIGRTQLFRSLAMFRCFGPELLSDLNAAARCTCEALKILASASVSDAARDAAMAHVRDGKMLTIKVAKKFQREFGSPLDHSQPAVATNRSVIWQYDESDVRILVKGLRGDGDINDESIVMALESALTAYRRVTVDNHTHPQVA